jgi:hypothetical protein
MAYQAQVIGQVDEKTQELIRRQNARIKLILQEFGNLNSFKKFLRDEGISEERWYKENCVNSDFLEHVLEFTLSNEFKPLVL